MINTSFCYNGKVFNWIMAIFHEQKLHYQGLIPKPKLTKLSVITSRQWLENPLIWLHPDGDNPRFFLKVLSCLCLSKWCLVCLWLFLSLPFSLSSSLSLPSAQPNWRFSVKILVNRLQLPIWLAPTSRKHHQLETIYTTSKLVLLNKQKFWETIWKYFHTLLLRQEGGRGKSFLLESCENPEFFRQLPASIESLLDPTYTTPWSPNVLTTKPNKTWKIINMGLDLQLVSMR